jgi:hypothetical protein
MAQRGLEISFGRGADIPRMRFKSAHSALNIAALRLLALHGELTVPRRPVGSLAHWLKIKNSAAPAVTRESEED